MIHLDTDCIVTFCAAANALQLSYFIPLYNGIYRGAIHLYGHSHTTDDSILEDNIKRHISRNGHNIQAYNVGCMYPYMNFTPQTLEEIVDKTSKQIINKGE